MRAQITLFGVTIGFVPADQDTAPNGGSACVLPDLLDHAA
jgi:hypothetical protein